MYYEDIPQKCQRPKRAYFISTARRSEQGSAYGCVNALNGLTSFLHNSKQWREKLCRKCVNALNGLTSFLQNYGNVSNIMGNCVNALNGLTSFLRGWLLKYYFWEKCVNALNGLTSFLQKEWRTVIRYIVRCQRPKRAYFISTPSTLSIMGPKIMVCQRPKRAYFISTKEENIMYTPEICVNALNGLTSFLHR